MKQRIFVHQLNSNVLTSLNSFTQAPQIGPICAYAFDYIKHLERVVEDNFAPSALARVKLQTVKSSGHLFGINEIHETDNPVDAFGVIDSVDKEQVDVEQDVTKKDPVVAEE
jgi:hypothetical protein